MARLMTRPTTRRKANNADVADLALHTLKSNSRLNFAARLLLLLFALGASTLAVKYVYERADATVESLRQSGAGSQVIWAQLLALSAPVLLLAMFAGLAAVAIAVVHSRGIDELIRTVDSVNRLRREGEVAISARGLIVAFENKLQNAQRAFGILLWLARSLFIVCIGLFTAAVIHAIARGVDTTTVVLGATSIVGVVVGLLKGVPRNVSSALADVIQIQSIVTGCDRQISLLETDAAHVLARKGSVEENHRLVLEIREQIDKVVADAVDRIQTYADPAKDGATA